MPWKRGWWKRRSTGWASDSSTYLAQSSTRSNRAPFSCRLAQPKSS